MGYALPAATSRRIVEKLKNGNGNLGVELVSAGFTYSAADSYSTGLNAQGVAEIRETVKVNNVLLTGAAYNKIKPDDVILRVKAGENAAVEVNRLHNLTDALVSVKAGDTVVFTVRRNGEDKDVSITYDASDFVRKS